MHNSYVWAKKSNGEVIRRSWVCLSPAYGRVYCFFCKLMDAPRSQFTCDGFYDWKHSFHRLVAHEQSKDHIQAVLSVASRAKGAKGIDSRLTLQMDKVEQYWYNVLKRLVSVLKFACERGLALRGNDETIGSPHNGNYLGLLRAGLRDGQRGQLPTGLHILGASTKWRIKI